MKNKLTTHDRIAQLIEDAVVRGSGFAAAYTAETIDKEFIVIPRSDLPAITQKYNYTRSCDMPFARTTGYYGGGPDKYFRRALDFLAIAGVAEEEETKQAERELAGKRAEAYKLLFPQGDAVSFRFESYPSHIQKQIDTVVGLMNQVDELKEAK